MEEFFSRHGLLLVKAKKGTRADGPEQNIRKALTELIVMLLDASGKEAEEPAVESDMMMTILDCFSEDDLICVEKILRRIEERQNYYFDELEYGRVSVGLLVTIYRIREGFSIPPKETGEDGKHRGIYRDLAGKIADGLIEDYGMEISATEQAAMAALPQRKPPTCRTLLQIQPGGRYEACSTPLGVTLSTPFLSSWR